jgi:hypothetical protein
MGQGLLRECHSLGVWRVLDLSSRLLFCYRSATMPRTLGTRSLSRWVHMLGVGIFCLSWLDRLLSSVGGMVTVMGARYDMAGLVPKAAAAWKVATWGKEFRVSGVLGRGSLLYVTCLCEAGCACHSQVCGTVFGSEWSAT